MYLLKNVPILKLFSNALNSSIPSIFSNFDFFNLENFFNAFGLKDIIESPESITGQFLSGNENINIPGLRRPPSGEKITIHGASYNNLKNIDCEIPLGLFVAIAGVSGSGKSTLIDGILKKALISYLNPDSKEKPGDFFGRG